MMSHFVCDNDKRGGHQDVDGLLRNDKSGAQRNEYRSVDGLLRNDYEGDELRKERCF